MDVEMRQLPSTVSRVGHQRFVGRSKPYIILVAVSRGEKKTHPHIALAQVLKTVNVLGERPGLATGEPAVVTTVHGHAYSLPPLALALALGI